MTTFTSQPPRFVQRFRRLAKEMREFYGPPEMAPGLDADGLMGAASMEKTDV